MHSFKVCFCLSFVWFDRFSSGWSVVSRSFAAAAGSCSRRGEAAARRQSHAYPRHTSHINSHPSSSSATRICLALISRDSPCWPRVKPPLAHSTSTHAIMMDMEDDDRHAADSAAAAASSAQYITCGDTITADAGCLMSVDVDARARTLWQSSRGAGRPTNRTPPQRSTRESDGAAQHSSYICVLVICSHVCVFVCVMLSLGRRSVVIAAASPLHLHILCAVDAALLLLFAGATARCRSTASSSRRCRVSSSESTSSSPYDHCTRGPPPATTHRERRATPRCCPTDSRTLTVCLLSLYARVAVV